MTPSPISGIAGAETPVVGLCESQDSYFSRRRRQDPTKVSRLSPNSLGMQYFNLISPKLCILGQKQHGIQIWYYIFLKCYKEFSHGIFQNIFQYIIPIIADQSTDMKLAIQNQSESKESDGHIVGKGEGEIHADIYGQPQSSKTVQIDIVLERC